MVDAASTLYRSMVERSSLYELALSGSVFSDHRGTRRRTAAVVPAGVCFSVHLNGGFLRGVFCGGGSRSGITVNSDVDQ